MRKIEREMNNAVRNKIAWSKSNTCTTFDSTIENCFVYLHGNHIATVTDNDLTLYSGGGGLLTPLSLDSMHLSKSFLLKVVMSFKRTLIGSLSIRIKP